MTKCEQIANELENGELSLEQSVDKFEEGIKISKKFFFTFTKWVCEDSKSL